MRNSTLRVVAIAYIAVLLLPTVLVQMALCGAGDRAHFHKDLYDGVVISESIVGLCVIFFSPQRRKRGTDRTNKGSSE